MPPLSAAVLRRSAPQSARSVALELVAYPEPHRFTLGRSGGGAPDLVVTLECRVPGRLVDQAERRDAAGKLLVAHGARRNGGVRVVLLVAQEGVQTLRALGGERVEEIVRPLDVAARDPAPNV